MSPEQIGAVSAGAGLIIAAWFTGRSKLKKTYENNGDGFERRKDSVSRYDHEACLNNREKEEKRLFKGQEKLEKKLECNRKENREDFQIVCQKIDALKG